MVSPPSRGCGSKQITAIDRHKKLIVTPFTGVWIETLNFSTYLVRAISHPLHGGVDRNKRHYVRGALRRKVTPFTGVWIETMT